ncbi:Hypothetical_protein [Hexamita inflata]|uniref:Hypothetical_protein n=1 Tax=Hexamita inflata TaxID=28002 RepID=A0AA86N4B9_9EUKA|nr:Hypothetical protein HINF_LOCUS235 [Hexamita inflata]
MTSVNGARWEMSASKFQMTIFCQTIMNTIMYSIMVTEKPNYYNHLGQQVCVQKLLMTSNLLSSSTRFPLVKKMTEIDFQRKYNIINSINISLHYISKNVKIEYNIKLESLRLEKR